MTKQENLGKYELQSFIYISQNIIDVIKWRDIFVNEDIGRKILFQFLKIRPHWFEENV